MILIKIKTKQVEQRRLKVRRTSDISRLPGIIDSQPGIAVQNFTLGHIELNCLRDNSTTVLACIRSRIVFCEDQNITTGVINAVDILVTRIDCILVDTTDKLFADPVAWRIVG